MGHSRTRGAETISLGMRVKDPAWNLSGSERNFSFLSSGTGFFPVRGARVSTWRHISGEGRFTTQSGQFLRLCRVFVSSSNPTVMVQPSAQKEEMGARLGEPSWSTELISATGVPKYRIFGLMVTNGASFCLVMGN